MTMGFERRYVKQTLSQNMLYNACKYALKISFSWILYYLPPWFHASLWVNCFALTVQI